MALLYCNTLKTGSGHKNISATDSANVNKVISYLEGLGNADVKPISLEITEEEKQKYLGEYRFGDGENEVFVVDLAFEGILAGGSQRIIPPASE